MKPTRCCVQTLKGTRCANEPSPVRSTRMIGPVEIAACGLDGLDRAWADYRAELADRYALPSVATGTAEERLRAMLHIREASARSRLALETVTRAMEQLSQAEAEANNAAWAAIEEDFGA